ncbi:MAG: ATP-binding cassette domain-containing protein, partial [Dermabacter sp.]|nr:ATP-binding cassette domain-containing protein [Dermabacter sp.]
MTTAHDSITVSNLTRTYTGAKKKKAFTAVDGISFRVREGEVYGLLGTNGAGKTSTLEILEGLAPATSGSLSVLGMHPTKDRANVRPHTGT